MHRSEEVKEVLLGILAEGLLRIRAFGWDGASDRCAHEADHLHNLPELVREPSLSRAAYYYDVSRMAFLKNVQQTEQFAPHWERLAAILAEAKNAN